MENEFKEVLIKLEAEIKALSLQIDALSTQLNEVHKNSLKRVLIGALFTMVGVTIVKLLYFC